jgi:RNA polymerase sigma-70 factor, ECF subfamily
LDTEITRIFKAKKDIREFDYFYKKYFPRINNFVFHRVYDEDVKNEIVSNVFFKAMKKLNKFRIFDVNKVTFSSWLYRIAVNEINQYFRNNKRTQKIENMCKHNYLKSSEKEEIKSISFETVKDHMLNLPVDDQNLITLRYFEKLSYQELAEIFKKSEGALKVKLHRALNKLRDLLNKELIHEKSGKYIEQY